MADVEEVQDLEEVWQSSDEDDEASEPEEFDSSGEEWDPDEDG